MRRPVEKLKIGDRFLWCDRPVTMMRIPLVRETTLGKQYVSLTVEVPDVPEGGRRRVLHYDQGETVEVVPMKDER